IVLRWHTQRAAHAALHDERAGGSLAEFGDFCAANGSVFLECARGGGLVHVELLKGASLRRPLHATSWGGDSCGLQDCQQRVLGKKLQFPIGGWHRSGYTDFAAEFGEPEHLHVDGPSPICQLGERECAALVGG